MNDTLKSIVIAWAMAVPAGLIGLVLGIVAWLPGCLLTAELGLPVPLGGVVLFLVAGPMCGLLGGFLGAPCCGWLGKMLVARLFGKRYALLGLAIFGLIGGSIVGVMSSAASGVLVGLFISPMAQ